MIIIFHLFPVANPNMQWISVNERLPEVDRYGDVNVLVCMDDDFITSVTYDKNNGWELWAWRGHSLDAAPQPPKGGMNNKFFNFSITRHL